MLSTAPDVLRHHSELEVTHFSQYSVSSGAVLSLYIFVCVFKLGSYVSISRIGTVKQNLLLHMKNLVWSHACVCFTMHLLFRGTLYSFRISAILLKSGDIMKNVYACVVFIFSWDRWNSTRKVNTAHYHDITWRLFEHESVQCTFKWNLICTAWSRTSGAHVNVNSRVYI